MRAQALASRYAVRWAPDDQPDSAAGIVDTVKDGVGGGAGPDPHELLEAALASCMTQAVRMAADARGLRDVGIAVTANLRHSDGQTVLACGVDLSSEVSTADRAALLEAARQSPVRRTLTHPLSVVVDAARPIDRPEPPWPAMVTAGQHRLGTPRHQAVDGPYDLVNTRVAPHPPAATTYETVAAGHEFGELRARFRRFAVPMTVLFLSWYFLYVMLAVFTPGFMAIKLVGAINIGLVLGLLQVVSTFAITAGYARWARTNLDPMAARLREHVERGEVT